MVISLAIRSGRQETSGDMKSTSAAPHLAAQSRKPAPRFCTKCAIVLRQKKVSKIPAVPGTFTTIGSIRRLPKVTGFALRSIQNTVGRLQAPDFRCWTSSRNRLARPSNVRGGQLVGCNWNAPQRGRQRNSPQDQEAQQHPQIYLPLLPPERESQQTPS